MRDDGGPDWGSGRDGVGRRRDYFFDGLRLLLRGPGRSYPSLESDRDYDRWVYRWRLILFSWDGEYLTEEVIGWWELLKIESYLHCSGNATSRVRWRYMAGTALMRPAMVFVYLV
jgi:hypothetical protein